MRDFGASFICRELQGTVLLFGNVVQQHPCRTARVRFSRVERSGGREWQRIIHKNIPLIVNAGTPLRLYLTSRLPKKLGEPVHARLLEPVFAFDRVVIPAGTDVLGEVTRIQPVNKMRRATAILGGDFTPLHDAAVQFTSLVLPDGRTLSLNSAESIGLTSIVTSDMLKPRKHPAAQNGGILGTVNTRAKNELNRRAHDTLSLVRGPDKKERLEGFLIAKLPYHPQWVRKGTRFDAKLREPLPFGTAAMTADLLAKIGSQPSADSIVHVRLVGELDSATSHEGDAVEALTSQPLFGADGKLILPEGSRMVGKVTTAQRGRYFHRAGRLRFTFQRVDVPPAVASAKPPSTTAQETGASFLNTLATMDAVEAGGTNAVKVDAEGTAKVVETKTRFVAPVISWMIAAKAADNDEGRHALNGSAVGNTGPRALGGASGFGLLGAAAAQAAPSVATALGFYGLGWSVYSNIIARGGDVHFGPDTVMDIRFGARQEQQPTRLRKILDRATGGQ